MFMFRGLLPGDLSSSRLQALLLQHAAFMAMLRVDRLCTYILIVLRRQRPIKRAGPRQTRTLSSLACVRGKRTHNSNSMLDVGNISDELSWPCMLQALPVPRHICHIYISRPYLPEAQGAHTTRDHSHSIAVSLLPWYPGACQSIC